MISHFYQFPYHVNIFVVDFINKLHTYKSNKTERAAYTTQVEHKIYIFFLTRNHLH